MPDSINETPAFSVKVKRVQSWAQRNLPPVGQPIYGHLTGVTKLEDLIQWSEVRNDAGDEVGIFLGDDFVAVISV